MVVFEKPSGSYYQINARLIDFLSFLFLNNRHTKGMAFVLRNNRIDPRIPLILHALTDEIACYIKIIILKYVRIT